MTVGSSFNAVQDERMRRPVQDERMGAGRFRMNGWGGPVQDERMGRPFQDERMGWRIAGGDGGRRVGGR